ncbi:MAG: hypothetical protein FWC34_02555 [Bacteroidetes bacterium]|nr:hypothetical protein [Bacteroidota bacterium]
MKKNIINFLKVLAYGLLIPLIVFLLANLAVEMFFRYYWGYIHGFTSLLLGFEILALFILLTIVYYIFCTIFFLTRGKTKFRKYLIAAFLIIPILLNGFTYDYGIDIAICFALFHLTFYILFFALRFLFQRFRLKHKKLQNTSFIFLMILMLCSCGQRTGQDLTEQAVEFIDEIAEYQKDIKFINEREITSGTTLDMVIRQTDMMKSKTSGSTFDINSYMQLYSLIRVQDTNKVFDCFYNGGRYSSGGHPIIFVKGKEQKIKEIIEEYGHASIPKEYDFRNQITTEDSPMGYLQLLYLHEFGESFALYWHEYYYEKYVIISKTHMREMADYLKDGDFFSCNKLVLLRLLNNNKFEPKIKLTNDYCIIEWIEIHTHSGIYRCKYKINRKDFSVKKISNQRLLKIRINFCY